MNVKIDEILRSKRRTISLEITRDARLVIHAPLKTSQRVIEDVVTLKQEWIQKKQNDARHRDEKYPPKCCKAGETFELLGETYILSFDDSITQITTSNGQLVVPRRFETNAQPIIIAWYKAQADAVLRQRTDYYADRAGVQYKSLKITSALTRWGSCSNGNKINFNDAKLCFTWRLIMAPVEMIDYVVVHELSHIGHPDHSRAFWQRVVELMPDYAPRREWFRQNSALLRHDFFADAKQGK